MYLGKHYIYSQGCGMLWRVFWTDLLMRSSNAFFPCPFAGQGGTLQPWILTELEAGPWLGAVTGRWLLGSLFSCGWAKSQDVNHGRSGSPWSCSPEWQGQSRVSLRRQASVALPTGDRLFLGLHDGSLLVWPLWHICHWGRHRIIYTLRLHLYGAWLARAITHHVDCCKVWCKGAGALGGGIVLQGACKTPWRQPCTLVVFVLTSAHFLVTSCCVFENRILRESFTKSYSITDKTFEK